MQWWFDWVGDFQKLEGYSYTKSYCKAWLALFIAVTNKNDFSSKHLKTRHVNNDNRSVYYCLCLRAKFVFKMESTCVSKHGNDVILVGPPDVKITTFPSWCMLSWLLFFFKDPVSSILYTLMWSTCTCIILHNIPTISERTISIESYVKYFYYLKKWRFISFIINTGVIKIWLIFHQYPEENAKGEL